MQKGLTLGVFDSIQMQLMHVPTGQGGEGETDGFAIRADLGRSDARDDLIHLRPAIVLPVGIGKGAHGVAVEGGGGAGVEGLRKGQLKAVRPGPHLMDLKGDLARPLQLLKAIGLPPACAPAAITAAGIQTPVRIHSPADKATGKAAAKGNNNPLFHPLDGLQEDAADAAVALVGDEELPLKGAELAAGFVADDEGGGVADLAMDHVNGGGGGAA